MTLNWGERKANQLVSILGFKQQLGGELLGIFVGVYIPGLKLSSVQFSRSVMSDSLRLHGLQHTRCPRSPPNPKICTNSCPSSWWCSPTLLSPSPSTFTLSRHQGLFQWVCSSHLVAKVFHCNWQSMHGIFPEALLAQGASWAWRTAATLWLPPVKQL